MFDIGFSELMVIGVVALVVIGPEKLPRVARTIGHLLGRMQRHVAEVKADISREIQLDEMRRLQTQVEQSAREFSDDLQAQAREIESSVRNTAEELHQSIANTAEPHEPAPVIATHEPQPVAPSSYVSLEPAPVVTASLAAATVAAATTAESLSAAPATARHEHAAPVEAQQEPAAAEVDDSQLDLFAPAPAAAPKH